MLSCVTRPSSATGTSYSLALRPLSAAELFARGNEAYARGDHAAAIAAYEASLRKGPGHYPATPFPGMPGTVGVAGHRTTYLAPFNKLDELRKGDRVVILAHGLLINRGMFSRLGPALGGCRFIEYDSDEAALVDAATGTVRWLEEHGMGWDVRIAKVPIDRTFRLGEAADAHRYLAANKNFGKVIFDLR